MLQLNSTCYYLFISCFWFCALVQICRQEGISYTGRLPFLMGRLCILRFLNTLVVIGVYPCHKCCKYLSCATSTTYSACYCLLFSIIQWWQRNSTVWLLPDQFYQLDLFCIHTSQYLLHMLCNVCLWEYKLRELVVPIHCCYLPHRPRSKSN